MKKDCKIQLSWTLTVASKAKLGVVLVTVWLGVTTALVCATALILQLPSKF